jgi:hypothetical protein
LSDALRILVCCGVRPRRPASLIGAGCTAHRLDAGDLFKTGFEAASQNGKVCRRRN